MTTDLVRTVENIRATPLQPRTNICCLIGAPGTGKTEMIARTARQPVHFIDVDRKLAASARIAPLIAKGGVTYWELSETLSESSLQTRLIEASKNSKPTKEPLGWRNFAQLVEKLPRDPVSAAAATWAIDSYTLLGDHLKRAVLHWDDKGISTMSQRNWGTYLMVHEETVTCLIDVARSAGKDLIITIHEKPSEVPNANTRVRHTKDAQGNPTREFLGDLDLRIAPTVEGQFATKMFSYFPEVYGLRVDTTGGTPKWVCRLRPDGKRDLRCTYDVKGDEVAPDFRLIWGLK